MISKKNDQGVTVEDMLDIKRRFRESGNRTSMLPTIMPQTSTSVQAEAYLNSNMLENNNLGARMT